MISLTIMSLVTSVKDYVEITHKALQFEPLQYYTELGALFSYLIISLGNVLKEFFSFSYLKNIWSIPLIIPDIASAMISEISVLDGYFHTSFTFLETSLNSPEKISSNLGIVILLKFLIGLINSLFLFLPTSTSHLITVRRFVMQGLEAGYIAGLGTLAGNFLWLSSIILGWRFFVIPWLSFDVFRYLLGFILIVKYIWDSSKERRMALEDISKSKIFLLNFLLALTEQTCIYPFISNLSFGPEASVLEGFAAENYGQFLAVHGAYLLGIGLGSFSLLQFTCWFWENPAFSIYIWITTKSSTKISTSSYYKIASFTFLYCTMLCAIASIPYYGLDYTITNPLGFVQKDRLLDQKKSQSDTDKLITETAFLGVNPTDKNTRVRDGVHARRERWKQRLIKYQAYDASVYDQGVYDFLTIEDLNYGFDRFWHRRKMRNHQIRFRLFPGPWMRSLKKQLNKPANSSLPTENKEGTKSATGPRVDFFRILFEQFYHPIFHAGTEFRSPASPQIAPVYSVGGISAPVGGTRGLLGSERIKTLPEKLTGTGQFVKNGLVYESSALRKFVRNFNKRTNTAFKQVQKMIISSPVSTDKNAAKISVSPIQEQKNVLLPAQSSGNLPPTALGAGFVKVQPQLKDLKPIYSKRWKSLFSKIQPYGKTSNYNSYLTFRNVSKQILMPSNTGTRTPANQVQKKFDFLNASSFKLMNINQKLSQEDLNLLLFQSQTALIKPKLSTVQQLMLVRPLSFYLQKEQAFKRKLRYYGSTTMRKLTVGNQAPYFKTLMKRGFYYYKPSLRLKKTQYVASMRRGFRKKSRKQKTLIYSFNVTNSQKSNQDDISVLPTQNNAKVLVPNRSSYSILNKRASRYRHQIYKDVLQHWYYTPFNRLALKFDIDAFINRQPKSFYLTKNEERLLHVKRFLLSEHYDTLRWYTHMHHYNTMKTNIGGTKSFASRIYNQQFQGTFKKIRHLFAITPTQENFSILKFDQPLYNNIKDKQSIYLHEELLLPAVLTGTEFRYSNRNEVPVTSATLTGSDYTLRSAGSNPLPMQSVQAGSLLVEQLSKKEQLSRGQEISLYALVTLEEGNQSKALTSSGYRTEFQSPAESAGIITKTSQTTSLDLINQTKNLIGQQIIASYEIPQNQKPSPSHSVPDYPSLRGRGQGQKQLTGSVYSVITPFEGVSSESSRLKVTGLDQLAEKGIYSELLVKLIKECKRHIYDQAFLKNYISHRIEKRDQRNQEHINELNKRLDKLKNWLNFQNIQSSDEKNSIFTTSSVTTGMEKALNDSIRINTNINPLYKNKPLSNSSTQKTPPKLLQEQKVSLMLERSLAKINIIKRAVDESSKAAVEFERRSSVIDQTISPVLSSCKKLLTTRIQFLKGRTAKNIEWWRKKQRVITKRKNTRKRDRFKKQMAGVTANIEKLVQKAKQEKSNLFKTLYGNYEISDYLVDSNMVMTNSNLLRKKQDTSRNYWERVTSTNPNSYTIWERFFVKEFRKKLSSKGRRYRSLSFGRYLTATRKPKMIGTFLDSNLEGENDVGPAITGLSKIDGISSSSGFFLTVKEKQKRLTKENAIADENNSNLSSFDFQKATKNGQIHKRSRHTWKKYKRHKFNTTQNKYRKRRIQSRGKLRVMNKKYKKIVATNELRQWWWNSFLPRYYNSLTNHVGVVTKSQITDTKFKPLSLTDLNNRVLLSNENTEFTLEEKLGIKVKEMTGTKFRLPVKTGTPLANTNVTAFLSSQEASAVTLTNLPSVPERSSGNLPPEGGLGNSPSHSVPFALTSSGYRQGEKRERVPVLTPTTNIPFYAGWDESKRKFVITNRLLSRRDTGLDIFNINEANKTQQQPQEVQGPDIDKGHSVLTPLGVKVRVTEQQAKVRAVESDGISNFTNAPLQGLNEGSFLYWQTDMPFNSYNIDQFIYTNQSFYAPLGWRRFEFRHSILKTWYSNYAAYVKNTTTGSKQSEESQTSIILNATAMHKMLNNGLYESANSQGESRKDGSYFVKSLYKRAIARRIKKRYKLLKQTPNQLMYTPTGPLLTEILPAHYISVFDQQYRFPRNRYLKRNLLKSTKKTTLLAMLDTSNDAAKNGTNNFTGEFTLRKRIKPRRKYHKKRFIKKDGLIFPRRTKFMSTEEELRWRPSSRSKQKRNLIERSKTKSNKRVVTNPLRLRQLRRREFQQILLPSQRYQPRNGGFTWPGDYLRLEVVDMPKLKSEKTPMSQTNKALPEKGAATSLKQKINVQPVGIMPRKYLIFKHNLLVLKKKLEKAHELHKLPQVIEEYKILTQNKN